MIINVDETWLGMTDFRRQKWRPYGDGNFIPRRQVVPRVSKIVGLSSRGDIYLSLLQSNSNASVMGIFFNSLIKKLSDENKYWYHSVAIILDNA